MTAGGASPWLAGTVGAPLVPGSWVNAGPWSALVTEVNSKRQARTRVVSSAVAGVPETTRSRWCLDLDESGWNIATSVIDACPAWRDEPLTWELDVDACLGDLPLRSTTREVLRELNMHADAKLASLASRQRSELLSTPEQAAALLDLSFALEHWWPVRESSGVWRCRHAGSLESFAEAIVSDLLNVVDGAQLDEQWVGAVLARQSWGVPGATLQEIGDDLGLTRERVRQVLARIDGYVGRWVWPVPDGLAAVVEAVIESAPRSIPEVVTGLGLATDSDWTAEEIATLLEWYGRKGEADALRQRWRELEEESRVAPEFARAIRASRSALGFMNLDTVSAADGSLESRDRVTAALPEVYSRVFTSGHWALTGTKEATMAEGVVARQFSVTPQLSSEEVMSGLERRRRARQADQLPPSDVVLALLERSGAIRREGDVWTGPASVPEPDSIEAWLVATLKGARGMVMHREMLLREGRMSGQNAVSLMQYISYSPVLRPVEGESSLFRLVGRKVSREDIEFALRVAAATRVDTDFAWTNHDGGTQLEVTVGSVLLTSGILNIDAALAGLWPADGASVECLCGRFFEGRISRYGAGNQLIGWNTPLAHLALEHGLQEGSAVGLVVRGDVARVSSLT